MACKAEVAIRIRPPIDPNEDIKDIYVTTSTTVTVRDPLSHGRNEHHFNFTRVFPPEGNQEQIFNFVAKPLVDHCLQGFNACCFAYGQTGSGKTHSVFGEGNAENRGMLARSIEHLFEQIEQMSTTHEIGMAASFTEVYLDQVRDLGRFYADKYGLCAGRHNHPTDTANHQIQEAVPPSNMPKRGPSRAAEADISDFYSTQDLAIHESLHGFVYVEDLSLIPVTNIREVLEIANLGVRMRATFETKLNSRSSRSHTVFTINIARKARGTEDNAEIMASAVNFVDLAGSERLARSQSEGRRFLEAVVVNTSLSALGKVVLALASNHRTHIPYRDSKLTRILQNSLGGNSYTTLLTTIDPSHENYEESLNSLFFADRCKNVRNKPFPCSVGEEDPTALKVIHDLLGEIAQLKNQLQDPFTLSVPAAVAPLAAGSKEYSRFEQVAQDQDAEDEGPLEPGQSVPYPTRFAWKEAATAIVSGIRMSLESKHSLQRNVLKQAQEKLRIDAAKTEEALHRLKTAEICVEQAWADYYERDKARREQKAEYKKHVKSLEGEVRRHAVLAENESVVLGRNLEKDRQVILDTTARVVEQRTQAQKAIPKELRANSHDSDSLAGAYLVAERSRIAKEVQAVKIGLDDNLVWQDREKGQRFREHEIAIEQLKRDMEEHMTTHRREQKKMDAKFVSAWELDERLRSYIVELQSGLPNTRGRSDVQPPSWNLTDFKASLERDGRLGKESIRQLHMGIAENKRLLASLQQKPPRPESLAANARIPGRSPRTPGSDAEIVAKTGVNDLVVEASDTWDPEEFARNFCNTSTEMAETDAHVTAEKEASLQHLGAPWLRRLGIALWKRVRMGAAVKELEVCRMRKCVVKELGEHARARDINQLENDIRCYEVRIQKENERNRQLASALKTCGMHVDIATCGLGFNRSLKAVGSAARAVAAKKCAGIADAWSPPFCR